MQYFKNDEEALEYAKNFGKYHSEVVCVNGKRTFLTSTCLPIEQRLRTHFEDTVREFVTSLGVDESDELDDGLFRIGAELEELVMNESEDIFGVRILSRNDSF